VRICLHFPFGVLIDVSPTIRAVTAALAFKVTREDGGKMRIALSNAVGDNDGGSDSASSPLKSSLTGEAVGMISGLSMIAVHLATGVREWGEKDEEGMWSACCARAGGNAKEEDETTKSQVKGSGKSSSLTSYRPESES
jgi:hypothetical protein